MERVNKHTVLKEIRTNGTWEGYIAPSNVNSFHITGGWHLGMGVLLVYGLDGKYYHVSHNASDYEELDELLNSFAYFNCHAELGKRVSFWKEPQKPTILDTIEQSIRHSYYE